MFSEIHFLINKCKELSTLLLYVWDIFSTENIQQEIPI